MTLVSFDIETYSSSGAFTEARHPGDCIHCISWITQEPSSLTRQAYCAVLGACPPSRQEEHHPLPGFPSLDVCVISYPTEKDLIQAFLSFLEQSPPTVLTGYNIRKFDVPYVRDRAARWRLDPSALLKLTQIDLWEVVKRVATGTQSTRLKHAVERHLPDLGAGKVDLAIPTVFAYHGRHMDLIRQDLSERADEWNASWDEVIQIALYCVIDSILPLELGRVLGAFPSEVSVSTPPVAP